jgi:nucleotide-binding universal stress UspA family protein
LRYRAAELRHELEEEARKRKIVFNFHVVRGSVEAEILAAAVEADLLALGRLGHAIARRPRLGSTARTALSRANVPVLLVQPDIDAEEFKRPVAVLFDGSAAAGRALDVAAYLARQDGLLDALIWAERNEQEVELRAQIDDSVQNLGVEVRIHRLQAATRDEFVRALRRQRPGLLVLGITESALPASLLQALLEDGSQQILAVR